jgi:hypothetical protein
MDFDKLKNFIETNLKDVKLLKYIWNGKKIELSMLQLVPCKIVCKMDSLKAESICDKLMRYTIDNKLSTRVEMIIQLTLIDLAFRNFLNVSLDKISKGINCDNNFYTTLYLYATAPFSLVIKEGIMDIDPWTIWKDNFNNLIKELKGQ